MFIAWYIVWKRKPSDNSPSCKAGWMTMVSGTEKVSLLIKSLECLGSGCGANTGRGKSRRSNQGGAPVLRLLTCSRTSWPWQMNYSINRYQALPQKGFRSYHTKHHILQKLIPIKGSGVCYTELSLSQWWEVCLQTQLFLTRYLSSSALDPSS